MSYRWVLKGSVLVLAAGMFALTGDRLVAQTVPGAINNPANLGAGLGIGLGQNSPLGGNQSILGNLAGGLPGQSGTQASIPGLSPTGRFYNYDLVTGSGQLTGPLPIVKQFAGIAGMRWGMMGGGMGMGGMGMGGMGMGGMGMGGMGMGGMGMGMGGGGMGMPGMGGGTGGGMTTFGMGGLAGNGGSTGSIAQQQNWMLLPPGVQLNQMYNTMPGLPLTQYPPPNMNGMMNPFMRGRGMGMGMGMGMPMGMGMGKMMYGNGGYGL